MNMLHVGTALNTAVVRSESITEAGVLITASAS